ncbi:Zinc finger CCCH domain-containing protein 18 [Dendrobium catenatum]|uniref:Zinc finger CCCH domain-containing protein 18 n=1 Tax=Dendrobium catenatum TaxID=906689 RepID=A0A2I0XDG6_9ASPA|nr:Zinc finger CCCH domain-containing protein 18 [Dendrobium catenatum]
MGSLSWTFGFTVLQSKMLCYSNKDSLNPKSNKSFCRFEKLRHKAHRQANPSYYLFSDSRTIRSFIAHSYAGDAVISESPNVEAIPTAGPGLASSESFGTRIFRDEYLWSAFEIAEAVGGEVVRWGLAGTISTDTRTLLPGQWFFAISGKNSDGHDYVDEALAGEKGCVGVIGNRVCRGWENGFIKVDGDTIAALEKMAKVSRNRFHGIVVGLTGSVGKTTTRTMIALALGSLGRIYQTHGNHNAMVGVALTLIGIPLDAKAAIVELGMNRMGEILAEARICCPSVRVILNVGPCHLEYLHGLENVAKAKGELLAEAKPGDICVLNGDDPLVLSIPIPPGTRKKCWLKLIPIVMFGSCLLPLLMFLQVGTVDEDFAVCSGNVVKERTKAERRFSSASGSKPRLETLQCAPSKPAKGNNGSGKKKQTARVSFAEKPVSFVSCGIMQVDSAAETIPLNSPERKPLAEVAETSSSKLGAFEMHTKGFGSRMLAKMGFIEGNGLGKSGQGMVHPIEPIKRPKSLGLGVEFVESATDEVRVEQTGGIGAFEKHTKGFGSRMMVKMGFIPGSGLGKDAQGMTTPLPAVRRPKLRGLGAT